MNILHNLKATLYTFLIIIMISNIPVSAATVREGLFSYNNSNGALIKYFGEEDDKDVEIPSNINGTDIVSISASAFASNPYIESVIIPDSVITIGNSVFQNCLNLKSIVIPDSVTTLGNSVFQGCTNLEAVTISDSLESMGTAVFRDCENLKSVYIPSSVTNLKNYTFQDCHSLQSVSISENISIFGNYVFANCINLEKVFFRGAFPETVGGLVFGIDDTYKMDEDFVQKSKLYIDIDIFDQNGYAYTWEDIPVVVTGQELAAEYDDDDLLVVPIDHAESLEGASLVLAIFKDGHLIGVEHKSIDVETALYEFDLQEYNEKPYSANIMLWELDALFPLALSSKDNVISDPITVSALIGSFSAPSGPTPSDVYEEDGVIITVYDMEALDPSFMPKPNR